MVSSFFLNVSRKAVLLITLGRAFHWQQAAKLKAENIIFCQTTPQQSILQSTSTIYY